MSKIGLFQDSFLIAGIMCHQGCGVTIQGALLDGFNALKQQGIMPDSATLIMDAEPYGLGIHRVSVLIECDESDPRPSGSGNPLANGSCSDSSGETMAEADYRDVIIAQIKEHLDAVGFEVMDDQAHVQPEQSHHVNQINILINLIAVMGVMVLSAVFPPSVWLTTGLTALSGLTTAFTARHYLTQFYHNIRNKNVYNMATTITLGWVLSLAHTLYHAITMPSMGAFSMTFMNYIMPVILIMVINGMDEIKRRVLTVSKKMQLNGMHALFPEMATTYACYALSEAEQALLSSEPLDLANLLQQSPGMLDRPMGMERKSALKKGMLIQVNRGECFPVDGIILQGSTQVDASLLTGESKQGKRPLDFVPAGAVNLGSTVHVYVTKDAYNSTVNQLLFVANRAPKVRVSTPSRTFIYVYGGLIGVGLVASILAPVAFGSFTVSVLLQNIGGILFSICPCTMAIAHELPQLLSVYHRSNKGILLRNETLAGPSDDIHTIVFDKTGTLTTGNSEVDSFDGISSALWQRIYLLEKKHGAGHPLAKAIERHYEASATYPQMITDIHTVSQDSNHRGLSAMVQGKSIHIGNAAFLQQSGIALPNRWPLAIERKLALGYSPVYVAQDHVYQGIILVKHEVNPDVIAALVRLKREGKRLIMLTGDSTLSAIGFNQQNGSVFEPGDVHAEQTPQGKERFLSGIMRAPNINRKGVWFVGDGLNDAPCARVVSEQGGVSCAMTSDDKAAFFTDISLNGSLDYLFQHQHINQFLEKIVFQNQGLLLYGALVSLLFIITLSMVGLAVSPLIPVLVMVSTTVFVLFNAYRINGAIDVALDQNPSWLTQWISHDASIGLLVSGTALFLCGVLISTVAMGALCCPLLVFTAGVAMACSSVCVIAASALLVGFFGLGMAYLWGEHGVDDAPHPEIFAPELVAMDRPSSPQSVRHRTSSSHGHLPYFYQPSSVEMDTQHDFIPVMPVTG